MASQSDRKSDGFGIAKRSQTIAVTAPDTETDTAAASEGRTPFTNSPSIHSFSKPTRATATSDQRAGLGLGIVWMDELSANDDEPDCIVCCMDDDAALCGRDLSEEEWAADDDDNVCAECYRIFNILESADGVECPGCWRALFEEPSK